MYDGLLVRFAFTMLYDVPVTEFSWVIVVFFEFFLMGSGLYLVSRGRGRRLGPKATRYGGYFLMLFGVFLLIALLT